jgi:sugar lactone lactonase YvrE
MRTQNRFAIARFVGGIASIALLAISLQSQVNVNTVAGGYPNDGGPATTGAFMFPQYVAFDAAGNMYVSDTNDHRVREVNAETGAISTFAGTGVAGFGHNCCCIQANIARIRFPKGVAVNSSGDVFFADSGNQRIQQVINGCKHTFAGEGTAGYKGDDEPAGNAQVNWPSGLATDSAGNLYIADTLNNAVRVVDVQNYIHTVAGDGKQGYSGDGGSATKAELNQPKGVWVDSNDNLYIADTNNYVVRMVTPWKPGKINGSKHTIIAGTITTIAGNNTEGSCTGDGGPATQAVIGPLRDVSVSNGTLYIANAGCSRIRAVNLSSGIISTYAGSNQGYDGEGNAPASARFSEPTGLAFNSSGDLVVADTNNSRVRQITTTVNTIAGGHTGDGGSGLDSELDEPENVAFDSSGNMYIVDTGANRVRKLSNYGTITTFAGSPTGISGYTGDGGAATAATLHAPFGVAVDSNNNVYIADTDNNVIRVVNSSGQISTFVKYSGFSSLASLATDVHNNVYAADQGSCVVWQITQAKAVSAVAGEQASCGYNGDGIAATTAELNNPYGIAVDSSGNLFIGDSSNNRVRMVNTSGTINTVAGDGTCGYTGDGGNATQAEICTPDGIAVDSKDNFYFGDWGNSVIRTVSNSGTINTLAGTGSASGYNGDGLPATQTDLNGPVAIAIKPKLDVPYLVDDQQYRVRRIE